MQKIKCLVLFEIGSFKDNTVLKILQIFDTGAGLLHSCCRIALPEKIRDNRNIKKGDLC